MFVAHLLIMRKMLANKEANVITMKENKRKNTKIVI